MLLEALLQAANPSSELGRAALTAHATLLEHGFVCVAAAEPGAGEAVLPAVSLNPDGSVSLRILPAGWNPAPDSFSFCYVHPLRGSTETFTVKAMGIGGSLAVHAASSVPGGELLTVTLKVDPGAAADGVLARAADWQEKTAAGIAQRLLSRHNSTARLGKALEGAEPAATPERSAAAAAGTKRPAPEGGRGTGSRAEGDEERGVPRPGLPTFPGGNPFDIPQGGFDDARPNLLWTPYGGLLGPRHPAWGQGVPVGPRGSRSGGGFLPRFDPIGPGSGDPDPDHLRVPGPHPDFDAVHRSSGRRGLDPDGMFIM